MYYRISKSIPFATNWTSIRKLIFETDFKCIIGLKINSLLQFQAGSGILNEITLEEKLRSELPCYMLPKPIKVPVIPSLVNGKVDRQALLQR